MRAGQSQSLDPVIGEREFLPGNTIRLRRGTSTKGRGTPSASPLSVLRRLSDGRMPEYERPVSMNTRDMTAPRKIREFLEGSEEAKRLSPVHMNIIDMRKLTWMPMHLAHRGIRMSPKEYDRSASW